ncbi:MAG: hypothetical protein ACR2OV_17220, partial [Hyphomicrobiaceae bacterium]
MDKLQKTLSRFKAERSWQLILLAVTSVILSVASGWTTWIGMQNFTDETILALMITFGIQGVMLVLAWHVGVRLSDSGVEATTVFAQSSARRVAPALSRLLEVTAVAALGAIALYLIVRYIFHGHEVIVVPDWPVVQYSATVLAAATIGVLALRFGYQLTSYFIHAFHFALRNSVPILMVTVCLFASVFFSFDALFSKIVPEAERSRLADLRSKTDIAAIFNKMQDATTESYRRAAREVLWGDDWLAYEAKLKVVRVAMHRVPQAATAKIEELRKDKLAQRQAHDKVLADLNIAKAEVERGRQRVVARLDLARERSSLLRAELTKLSKAVFDIERKIVEKTAEADAEERGIGVTSVRGRGPAFRRLSEEIERLREEKANAELRRDGYRKRSAQSIDAVSALEKEVATLAARIEQFDNRIEQQRADPQSNPESISLARVQGQVKQFDANLEASRLRFEQNPSRATLDALQNQCAKGAGFVASFDLRTNSIEGNACSTASLQAAAARLFTLNEAKPALATKCISSNPTLVNATVGGRLTFVRECLNLSGLLPSESKSITADINALERERDDQAHRFVVTYNAFLDGNKLAFLALAIATAVDILVLASGLLGATAIRSSLAGRGLRNDLSASERELMIETALMPDVGRNARRAIAEFNPIAKRELGLSSHWTHELVIDRAADSSLRSVLRRLMNAGMTIGAVTAEQRGRGVYRVNVSLIEFLIKLARASGAEGQQDQEFFLALERALGDSQAEHATALLQYFLPTNRVAGYTSRIDLPNVVKEDQQALLRCLNVASSFGYVADTETKDAELDILVSAEVYLALLNMAAAQGQDDSEIAEDWPQSSDQADVQIRRSSQESPVQPVPSPSAAVQPPPPPAPPQAPPRPRNYIGARLDTSEPPTQQPAVLQQKRQS